MLVTGRNALANRSSRFLRRNKAFSRIVRAFAVTTNPPDALTLHPSDISTSQNTPITQLDSSFPKRDHYASTLRQRKYDELIESLDAEDTNPDWIWTYYADLLDFTRDEALPLEIHQRVLRRCTPEPRTMRNVFVGRLRERRGMRANPHRYEGRFLAIINNIRREGYSATLEDYEFILKQFAAVGHYIGAVQVLQEVIKMQLSPRTRTFGLCLQAIAFRLTLPRRISDEEKIRSQCSQLCLHVASLIRKRKQRVPSACLDLILRIMKDTDNPDIFNSLLKVAYGIDLDYLDRDVLPADNGLGEPEPFSTAALTTLVDFLGRQNQVSRMVAAFEVLSTPLSVNPTEARLQNFDDEDDDYPIPSETSKPCLLPFARPNTTTYNTLIRHCTRLRKPALAKHYTLQALALDYSSSARLLSDIRSLPLADVPPPKVRVDVDTFRPILSLGKRNCELGLIRWLLPHFRMALQRKKQDFEYYLSILERSDGEFPQPSYERHPDGLRHEYRFAGRLPVCSSKSQDCDNENADSKSTESSVTFFTPSSTSTPLFVPDDQQSTQEPLDNALKSVSRSDDTRSTQFDLSVHVQVLQRDVESMKLLDARIGKALARLSIRIKEALGRRVWAGKPIYLRDIGGLVKVTREDWMEIVNFGGLKPRCRAVRKKGSDTVKIIPATNS